jgi:CubicO group peptidase (beta-lactamase class C family)
MTSGAKWSEKYLDPNSDVAKIRAEPAPNGSDPIVAYMARLPREAEPGTKFGYKTGETHLLGAVVRAATKKDLSSYLSEKIWGRIGMERDAYWLLDTAGHEFSGCCISASARDFARFGHFFMHGAKIDGVSILPDNWFSQATTSSTAARKDDGSGYGFQWWINPGGVTFMGKGIFGQLLFLDPTRDLVIVVQSAWPLPTDPNGVKMWDAFTAAVQRAIPASATQRH